MKKDLFDFLNKECLESNDLFVFKQYVECPVSMPHPVIQSKQRKRVNALLEKVEFDSDWLVPLYTSYKLTLEMFCSLVMVTDACYSVDQLHSIYYSIKFRYKKGNEYPYDLFSLRVYKGPQYSYISRINYSKINLELPSFANISFHSFLYDEDIRGFFENKYYVIYYFYCWCKQKTIKLKKIDSSRFFPKGCFMMKRVNGESVILDSFDEIIELFNTAKFRTNIKEFVIRHSDILLDYGINDKKSCYDLIKSLRKNKYLSLYFLTTEEYCV